MKPTQITDAPERREVAIGFETRDIDDGTLTLTGYASVFEKPYPIYGGPAAGGFDETIDRKAFDRTLAEKPDVHLLVNHEGLPLARTKSGTLDLSTDNTGLKVVARLDRSDPDVQRLEPKMRRGDMDEMSFAFRVKAQEWSEDETQRRITEVSLHKGDVSVVNWGANPATSAQVRSLLSALAAGEKELLAEVRSLPEDQIRAASRCLAALFETEKRAVRGALAAAREVLAGRELNGREI
ncbi:HK97 family phage prohead protease [Gordonia iterans]